MSRIPKIVTAAGAARAIGVTRQRVAVLIKQGSLATIHWQGKAYVAVESLERYVASAPKPHPNQKAGIKRGGCQEAAAQKKSHAAYL